MVDTPSKTALYNKLGIDPLTVMRKLGLNVPSQSDISTGIKSIVEGFSRGSDAKEMTTGSEEFSEGNYLSGGAKMLGGLAGMAVPFSGKIRSAGKAVGKNIDDIIEKKLAPKESEFFEEMINAKGKKKLQQKDGTFKDGEEYGDLYDLKYDVPSINIVRNKDGNKILSMNKKDMDNFFKWSENFPDKKSLPIAIKSDKFFNRFKPSGKELKEEGGQVLPMQYGGGLDDAYMNRRRSSAFAAPDATSAFASPMSMGGLPTIYRDVGGGVDDDYAAAGEYADMVSDAMAGDYTGADFGDEGGSYQKQMEAAMSVPSAQISDLAASPDLGYSTSEITAIKEAQRAAAKKDEADRRIGYLTGTTRTATDQRTSIPTKEEYEKTLNKYGYEPYQSTYLSGLINKGYDLKQAQSILASAMATPGGIQGMQNAFRDGYSYGGPAGTLLDLLERGTMQSLGIDDVLKKNKEFMEEDRKKDLKDNPDLSEGFLDSVGLGGVSKIVDKITDAVSLQGEVSPRVNTAITEQVKGAGWDYTPVSSILAKGMDYGISAVGNLVAPGLGAGLKGLANITDTGKTIGTLTKDGMSFNVNITKDGGRLSINMPTVNYDEGNVSDSDRQSRPVQQKVATSTTEDKKKNYMKDYLAGLDSKEDEGGLSNLKNYYETQALKYVYPDKSDEEINTMINKP